MIGSIRWNIAVSAVVAFFTFLVSISRNILTTSLIKSLSGALVCFVLVFAVRWVVGTLAGLKELPSAADDEAHIGASLDFTTPDDEPVPRDNSSLRGDEGVGFAPLAPPKLATKAPELDPEELAKAVRHMSEE